MNRRDFIQKLSSGALGAVLSPQLIPQLFVRHYAMLPRPITNLDVGARITNPDIDALITDLDVVASITALGVGPLGSRMAQLLSRNLPGIRCHDIIFLPEAGHKDELDNLFSAVRSSDILFLLTGFDGVNDSILFQAIAEVAVESKILAVGIIANPIGRNAMMPGNTPPGFDCVFTVSADSLTGAEKFLPASGTNFALAGYAMRQIVTTISLLLHQRSGICIDFADIAHILRSGRNGLLGSGVAAGPVRGTTAAHLAMDRLVEQGGNLSGLKGIIVGLHGSSLLEMQDFDDVSRVILDHVGEDTCTIVGVIFDEAMGNNVKVTAMAVR